MAPQPSQESFTFTVGKLDAGMAILLGERAHLIEFPSLLLPPGVTAGSIVNIAVHQNHAEEKKRDDEFWALQDEILETFGKRSPEPPKLKLRNVTQASITLEWLPLQLATSKLRSLVIYKNRQRLASIPSPLQNTSTTLSGLELDTEYSIQLVLRTTGGTFPSNTVRVKTHTTINTSGIRVCFGTIQDLELLKRAEAALEEMGAGWSNKIQIDTTHFVCTTPTATTTAGQAGGGGTVGISGPGVEYQRALQLSIPIIQPQWILACLAEKRMVPIQQFYLGNPHTPSSSSYPRPQSMSQASLTSANANTQTKTHANNQSVPAVHTSPSSPGTDQRTPPSQPPLEPTPEEGEEKSDEAEGEASKEQKPTGRRREGTMNKSFKFPPGPTPFGSAPPIPDIPKDLATTTQESKPRAEEKRARKSKDSGEVAVVASSVVEVLPPPPIERERMNSSVSDLDDVGETEEISLN